MKYDISIALPGIRPHLWRQSYDSTVGSVGSYTFEIIFVGPYDLPEDMKGLPNVKFIKDFGSPTRCSQIAFLHAEGELIMQDGDDGVCVKGMIRNAINLYKKICGRQDGLIMKYTEGHGYPEHSTMHGTDEYWQLGFHENYYYMEGVINNWRLGDFLLNTDYVREIGGIDCVYKSQAMGMTDLTCRVQNNGGKLHLTPFFVKNFDWNPNEPAHKYVQRASEDDWPVFESNWDHSTDRYKIPFDNWESSPEKWDRFSGPAPTHETASLQAKNNGKDFCDRRRAEVAAAKGHTWKESKRYLYGAAPII